MLHGSKLWLYVFVSGFFKIWRGVIFVLFSAKHFGECGSSYQLCSEKRSFLVTKVMSFSCSNCHFLWWEGSASLVHLTCGLLQQPLHLGNLQEAHSEAKPKYKFREKTRFFALDSWRSLIYLGCSRFLRSLRIAYCSYRSLCEWLQWPPELFKLGKELFPTATLFGYLSFLSRSSYHFLSSWLEGCGRSVIHVNKITPKTGRKLNFELHFRV